MLAHLVRKELALFSQALLGSPSIRAEATRRPNCHQRRGHLQELEILRHRGRCIEGTGGGRENVGQVAIAVAAIYLQSWLRSIQDALGLVLGGGERVAAILQRLAGQTLTLVRPRRATSRIPPLAYVSLCALLLRHTGAYLEKKL